MQTQGAMFGLAAGDIDFLRRVIHVRRQVKLAGTTLRFAPVKTDKAHDVPLPESLAPVLAEHIRQFPPVVAWLGDGQKTVLDTYAHFMPDDDDRGRRAMDQFFERSAPDVPSVGDLGV